MIGKFIRGVGILYSDLQLLSNKSYSFLTFKYFATASEYALPLFVEM